MNFELPESTQLLRSTIRDYAETNLAPLALENDENQQLPMKKIAEMAEMGILGAVVAAEYGGAGMSALDYTVIIEEIARIDPGVALAIAAHNSLACNHIYLFGTEELKQKFLAPLAEGRHLGCWGLSEPGSGSDAAAMLTVAERRDDHYLLNGTKNFITNGSHAGVMVVLAKTDRSATGSHGVSAFIVETDRPGFSVTKKENKLGMRASDTVQIAFEDVKIPLTQLLGKEGEGFKQAMKVLDGGRISIAALSLGLAQGSYENSVRYAQQRIAFGKPLSGFQATQFKLAEMAVEIEAARLLTYRAAWMKDQGLTTTMESAMAKYFAGEAAVRISSEAVQIFGGYGFVKDYPVERFFRDSRLCTIGEGTSEIQKIIIARELLRQFGE